MTKKMGELTVKHEGKEYRLCLTNMAIGTLQDEYGNNLEILNINSAKAPNMGVLVRVIQVALMRHHKEEATVELSDDLLGHDRSAFADLIKVSFPDPKAPTTGKKTPAAKKKTT